MEKEIIDLLTGLVSEPEIDSRSRKLPQIDVSGEIVFCIETLITNVGKKLNQSPLVIFESLLSKGVAAWLNELSYNDKKSIGYFNKDVKFKNRNSEKVKRPDKPVVKTFTRKAETKENDESIAVKAQQAAYNQLNDVFGYTPLTSHAVKESANGNQSGGESRKRGERSSSDYRKNRSRIKRKNNGSRSRTRSGSSN